MSPSTAAVAAPIRKPATERAFFSSPICRSCGGRNLFPVIDFGDMPIANRLLASPEDDDPKFSLAVVYCEDCHLVQTRDPLPRNQIFTPDYPFFSGVSKAWRDHCAEFAEVVTKRLGLNERSLVLEIASNDGTLLANFGDKDIPVLGIEPCESVAREAARNNVPTRVQFFGEESAQWLAADLQHADLIVCNNVLAHVPDPNDFVRGLRTILKWHGVVTIEFPWLLNLIKECQFDTIYHEHYSYLSLHAVTELFARHGLKIFDVEQIKTHGGSLRVWAARKDSDWTPSGRQLAMLAAEREAGLDRVEGYRHFAQDVRDKLDRLKRAIGYGKKAVAGFAASAKGATLLNLLEWGGGHELLYVVDDTAAKQGKYIPGVKVPIVPRERLGDPLYTPNLLLILSWNWAAEIKASLKDIEARGIRMLSLADV